MDELLLHILKFAIVLNLLMATAYAWFDRYLQAIYNMLWAVVLSLAVLIAVIQP